MTAQINMVRGILISPYMQTVSEIYVEPTWEGICYALGKTDAMFSGVVECVNIAQVERRGVDVWIDEESNLSAGRPVFHLVGQSRTTGEDIPIMSLSGSCLILDNDGEGESIGTEMDVSKLTEKTVRWTRLETTGDFGEPREYTTDHPILGPDTHVYEGGKPIYRERAVL